MNHKDASMLVLPAGYTARAPTPGDLDAVVAFVRACELEETGEAEMTSDDMRGAWERVRFDLTTDAWLVHDSGGQIAVYGEVWPREGYTVMLADGYVHPRHTGRGFGRWIIRTMEERARELVDNAAPGESVIIHNTINAANREGSELLASEGYKIGRTFWRMLIEMDEELPPSVAFPQGVSVRNFQQEDAPVVHEVVMTAFKDNAGHQYSPFEEWQGFLMDRETFDPALWWVAEANGEIVAVALCPKYEGSGWIRQFAVRKDYRGRGIAGALLRHVFREQYARGMRKVGLVVDSYNRTGARAVYERAGMHVQDEYNAYEKEIRPATA